MEQETELTIIHGRVIEALDLLGVVHNDEHPIEVAGEEFQLDCYLPDYHICVEADGPSHGLRGKKDDRRDKLLERIGIPTLRIRWGLIDSGTVAGLASVIRRFLVVYNGDIAERRAKQKAQNLIQRSGGWPDE